jgi:hypothetical protein
MYSIACIQPSPGKRRRTVSETREESPQRLGAYRARATQSSSLSFLDVRMSELAHVVELLALAQSD